tara:strand:- start:6859 stop:7506 length:648 start_codon:yes stop_codon:yes gene_type:complete
MYLIISGMNNITINLSKKLIADGNEITFVGTDEKKSLDIEKEIGYVSILGNSYNKNTLIEAGIERADYFIASTLYDDINFLSSEIAKSLNENIYTICLVNKIENKDIFNGNNFDFVIKYDEVISDNLNSYIANKFDQLIYTNTDNHTEVRIISVGKESEYVGKTVSEINLPNESEFIAVISSSGVISHNINNSLSPLDRILIQNTINYKDNDNKQ